VEDLQSIGFEASAHIRQAVLALDAWTGGNPSWERRADGTVANRPPAYAGAALGGLWRMRAYPSQRFNDRAAIYYAAELRDPRLESVRGLAGVSGLRRGRVAPVRALHRARAGRTRLGSGGAAFQHEWRAGLGIRAWASGFVLRVDTAFSDEGGKVQMMISQPFQFF
jgi:hypothetical protein